MSCPRIRVHPGTRQPRAPHQTLTMDVSSRGLHGNWSLSGPLIRFRHAEIAGSWIPWRIHERMLEYSLYKHGVRAHTDDWADRLVKRDLLLPAGDIRKHRNRWVVISTPSGRVPSASAALAERVAALLKLPHVPLRSQRRPWVPKYTRLESHARRLGQRTLAGLKVPRQLRGRDILLVEDMITTGATLDALASRLSCARSLHACHLARLEGSYPAMEAYLDAYAAHCGHFLEIEGAILSDHAPMNRNILRSFFWHSSSLFSRMVLAMRRTALARVHEVARHAYGSLEHRGRVSRLGRILSRGPHASRSDRAALRERGEPHVRGVGRSALVRPVRPECCWPT
jgi:hypothetical protein